MDLMGFLAEKDMDAILAMSVGELVTHISLITHASLARTAPGAKAAPAAAAAPAATASAPTAG
ncbi:hypothetical protein ACWDA9_10005 [Streptomyces sp. NPDC001193]